MKSKWKRLLASVLAASMLLSMVQIAGFAAGRTEDKKGEVVNGAFVAADGVLGGYDENASNTVKTPGGKVTVTKSAEAVACLDGNQFEVTLQVVTKDKISETISTPDAAVTLVIDVSGSMDDKVNGKTKMAAAIDSAKAFLASLKENTPTNSDGKAPARYVSVVAFSGKAQVKCEWQDIMTDDGYRAVESAINGLKANGGTNLQDGFIKANTLMQTAPAISVAKENRFTVLLSDGCPQTYNGEGLDLNPEKRGCEKATEAAGELKKNSNAIYSVYYGKLTDICYNTGDLIGWLGKDVTINDFLKTFSNNIYSAENADQLTDSFENISNIIALLTKAWEVSDPMGPNVKIEEVLTNQGTSVVVAENTLTWKLREDVFVKGGTANEPTYTYTLKYLVTVDASGEGWTEDAVHPLNDYTFLRYAFYQDGKLVNEDGTEKADQTTLDTIGFNVPGVKVQRPERGWTIEYYKQENATKGDYANYTKVETDTKTGKDEVGTQINLTGENGKDQNYETKYAVQNYEKVYVVGDGLKVELNPTQDPTKNVIKVYYDRKTTSVAVNHYYKTINADGTETGWSETPDDSNIVSGKYVGDLYTAEKQLIWGGAEYTFDHGDDQEITLSAGGNVLNLYYIRDARADANVVVNHVYRTHTWTLENGKYVLKDTETPVNEVEKATQKVTTTYTANNEPLEIYSDYTAAEENDTAKTITLHEDPNTITLYFDKTVDERGTPFTVNVKHNYTKSETRVDTDGTVRTDITNGTFTEESETLYPGERFTATLRPEYEQETYISSENNKTVYNYPVPGMTINLYYTLTKVPEKTTVTVTHIYQTVTHETVYTIDSDTKVITGTEDKVTTKTDKTVEDAPVEVYVGQKYTATLRGDGYTYHSSTPDNYTIDHCVVNGNAIEIIYQKSENIDNRDEATVDVLHRYTTHVTAIVGGVEKTFDIVTSEPDQATTGKVGDKFQAKTKLTDAAGNTYTLVGNGPAEVVLHVGTNDTIVIDYERSDDQRGEQVDYTVNYKYYTRTMTVENGVAVWGEPVLDTETTKTPTGGKGYVGQKVELDTGAKDGYYAMEGNPSATQFLKNGNNEWTFQYVKDVPLAQVNVTVNHHITTRTLTIDGETKSTQDLMGRPEYKYEGEAYSANAYSALKLVGVKINGVETETVAEVTGNANTDVVVDFYYEIVNDYRVPATYTVQHIYRTIDQDGNVTERKPDAVTTTGIYAFTTAIAGISISENSGYELTGATYNDTVVTDKVENGQYKFTVQPGTNDVVFTYERRVDTRADVTLTLTYDANGGSNAPGADSQTVKEGESATFTVKGQESMTRSGYTFQGWATSADGAVAYRVADSITISENTTLYAVWSRNTTPNPDPDPDPDPIYYYTLTINYVDESGNVVATQYTSGRQVSGWNYSVTSPEVEGMTPDQETVSGILTRNTTITVVYTAVENVDDNQTPTTETPEPTESTEPTETPEPVETQEPEETEELEENNTPLTETPDVTEEPEESEELEENDTPLAEVPQTGDSLGLWIMLALCSAAGLAWIALTEKKGRRVTK